MLVGNGKTQSVDHSRAWLIQNEEVAQIFDEIEEMEV